MEQDRVKKLLVHPIRRHAAESGDLFQPCIIFLFKLHMLSVQLTVVTCFKRLI